MRLSQPPDFLPGGSQGSHVDFPLEGEVVQVRPDFQRLQFGVGVDGGKDVARLRPRYLRGGLSDTDVVFQGLVVFLYFPSSLIDVIKFFGIRTGIVGDEIEDPLGSIFVCER